MVFLASFSYSQDTLLIENFNDQDISGWTIYDNSTDTSTWELVYDSVDNLGDSYFMIVDSDAAGAVDMDEELETPIINSLGYINLYLEFDQYFNAYTANSTNEKGEVEVFDGANWNVVYTVTADTGAWGNPDHRSIDITSYANENMKIRFHYYDANYDWYWAVDNVVITGTMPSCPTIGFDDIIAGSPYGCNDTIYLTAYDSTSAGGFITPGFRLVIETDLYSDTENTLTIYQDGVPIYYAGIGEVPEYSIWTIWGEYMDPTANYTFTWCDEFKDGDFPYQVYDNVTGALLINGTMSHDPNVSCFTKTIGSLTSSITFSGTGVEDFGNTGEGIFVASNAGNGTFDIQMCFDDGPALNCQDCSTQSITVSPINADAGNDQSICQGGSILLGGSPTATSGSDYINYSWSPTDGLDDPTLANPTATLSETTQFIVTVVDSICGTASDTVVITIDSLPVANAGTDTSNCTDTGIQIGGSPSAQQGSPPYTYAWSPVNGLDDATAANPIANPASPTTYDLVVTDANGCMSSASSVTVELFNSHVAHAGPDIDICFNGSGQLGDSPAASGGSGMYSYSWTPTNFLDDPNISNPTASPGHTEAYVLHVFDSVCGEKTDTVIVNVGSELFANAGDKPSYCYGDSAQLGGQPTAAGGTEPYFYLWSPASDLSDSTISNPFTHSTITETYYVTVTDANGCTDVANTTCTVRELPVIDAGPDQNICISGSVQIGGIAISGFPPYSYNWVPADGLDHATTAQPEASPISTTNYTVIVSDSYSCESSDQVIVNVASDTNEYILSENESYITAGGTFYDPGGATGDYYNDDDYTVTFFPCDNTKKIELEF
ncbi:MAG: hypothetical protein C0594_05085, partial [Marinilabiliales bacterium]